jgi:hypothetical protein
MNEYISVEKLVSLEKGSSPFEIDPFYGLD